MGYLDRLLSKLCSGYDKPDLPAIYEALFLSLSLDLPNYLFICLFVVSYILGAIQILTHIIEPQHIVR